MSHTKLPYPLLIENHLKHLKHEYGRLLGSEDPPLYSVEMALAALLGEGGVH